MPNMTTSILTPSLLSLPCSDPAFPEPEIFGGLTITQRNIEQAGEAHLTLSLKKLGLFEEEVEEKESSESDSEEVEESSPDGAFDKSKLDGKRKKKPVKVGGEYGGKTYYEALGLGHLGFSATERDVKKAHRKMVLKYHPDKFTAEEYTEAAKQRWLMVNI